MAQSVAEGTQLEPGSRASGTRKDRLSRVGSAVTRRPAAQLQPVECLSLDELIWFFQNDRQRYPVMRKQYERENGIIRDSYFTKNIAGGAVIVKPHGWIGHLSQLRKIRIRYEGETSAGVQPDFEAALWRARAMERESGLLLFGTARKVLVEMLFSVSCYLLGVLDSVLGKNPALDDDGREKLDKAIATACKELDRLDKFARRAARTGSLRLYLLGLPFGAGALALVTFIADQMRVEGLSPDVARICLVAGGIGAVVSVMIRISRGNSVRIDSQQGHLVTILAGSFRPLIGAVFGLALYVLIEGGLVPLAFPEDSSSHDMFFAGIAFLAGFSERWAQDTIVQSVPRVFPDAEEEEEAASSGPGATQDSER